MEIQTLALPVIALVLSGLTWTMFGYFSAWRKNHTNEDWQGFEPKKLRADLLLGFVLGIGSVGATILLDGDLTPIATAQGFLLAIQAGFGVVAAVDKFIIGGLLGK